MLDLCSWLHNQCTYYIICLCVYHSTCNQVIIYSYICNVCLPQQVSTVEVNISIIRQGKAYISHIFVYVLYTRFCFKIKGSALHPIGFSTEHAEVLDFELAKYHFVSCVPLLGFCSPKIVNCVCFQAGPMFRAS